MKKTEYKFNIVKKKFLWWEIPTLETGTNTTIKYSYSKEQTDKDPLNVNIKTPFLFNKIVVGVHTHIFVDGYNNSNFSPEDKDSSEKANLVLYLYTADGLLKRYDPVKKEDTLLPYDLPKDPNLK